MENTKKNPFDAFTNMYEESVEKVDGLGYADKFKTCTELFFESVNDDWLKDDRVHFSDIEFLSGYFIFGHGTNSVVHFHVDECPGWLFGIWWSVPDDSSSSRKDIDGKFFAQYEETIDKFKPSRSEFCETITVIPDGDNADCTRCYNGAKVISFIKHEPFLAFCRDYWGWNYNQEYHTREEAEITYNKYRTWHDNKAKCVNECDQKILSFVKTRILPLFVDAEIKDCGEDVSPRYDVVAPLKKNKDIVKKPGIYTWFDDDDEDGKQIMDEFNMIKKECDKIADDYEFCYFYPIDQTIHFYK